MKFTYTPSEWEQGRLFQPERMELSECNLELSDQQIAHFEQLALQEFKAQRAEARTL